MASPGRTRPTSRNVPVEEDGLFEIEDLDDTEPLPSSGSSGRMYLSPTDIPGSSSSTSHNPKSGRIHKSTPKVTAASPSFPPNIGANASFENSGSGGSLTVTSPVNRPLSGGAWEATSSPHDRNRRGGRKDRAAVAAGLASGAEEGDESMIHKSVSARDRQNLENGGSGGNDENAVATMETSRSDNSRCSSASSQRSFRSSISDNDSTRLRITDGDSNNARKKFTNALRDAFRKEDTAFLCNVLGYEETVIEFCALQKPAVVRKLLMERPELMVEADMFIPQPGILLNENTARALSKSEYIKAFATYNTVLFDLQVSEAVRKEDKDAINALPVLRLGEAAKEACRQGKEELCAFVLERLYRGVPSAGDNPTVFGKREPVEVVERYNRAHQLALQRSKQKPTRSGSQGSAYKVGVGDFKSQCCTVQ